MRTRTPPRPCPNAQWVASLAAWLCVSSMTACGGGDPPSRVWTGQITGANAEPLSGAIVSVGEHWVETGPDGTFRLRDVTASPSRPWTATAREHVAWSLATEEAGHLVARLQPRRGGGWASTGDLALVLSLPEPAERDRTVYISVDHGQVLPVYFTAGNVQTEVSLVLPVGRVQLSALAPGGRGGEGWYAAPIEVEVGQQSRATLELGLAEQEWLTLELEPAGAAPVTPVDVAVVCSGGPGAWLSGLASVGPGALGAPVEVELLGPLAAASCDVTASYASTVGLGDARHVAFLLDQDGDGLGGAELQLDLPGRTALQPSVRGLEVTWPAVGEATVYDVYVARREGASVGEIVWSGTTASAAITLPLLPEPARERFGLQPGDGASVRVIARRVPGFDIETAWDWSAYDGYVASPWLAMPDAVVASWVGVP